MEPREGELLRLEREDGGELVQSLAITGHPGSGRSEGGGALARLGLDAEGMRRRVERSYPGARVSLEGLGRLEVRGGREAYQLAFTAPAEAGGLLLGKVLVVPRDSDDDSRGVVIEAVERTEDEGVIERAEQAPATLLFNWPSPALLEDEAAVQNERGLEEPLRSFDFL